MSVFAKRTPAPGAKSQAAKQIAWYYAGIITVMLVAQLFTFEKFLELIVTFNLPMGEGYILVPIITVAELFALPFLLRMPLSIAFRWLSMVCGWFVAVFWLFISLWLTTAGSTVESVGFLGSIGELSPGWWAVFISLSFVILAAWSAWGLWPVRPKAKKVTR